MKHKTVYKASHTLLVRIRNVETPVSNWPTIKPIALSTEAVKSTARTFESIDHVKGSNGFTSFQVSTQQANKLRNGLTV